MKTSFKPITATAALLALAATCTPALATENGGSSYANGVESVFAGLMGQEGLSAYAFVSNYSSNALKDNAGNTTSALNSYKLNVSSLAAGLSYVHPGFKLLGASVETRGGFLAPSTEIALDVKIPGPVGHLNRSDSTFDVSDLLFAPLVLGWHGSEFHQSAGVDFVIPVATYDSKRLANPARNYLQSAPFYGVTWLPQLPVFASAKVRYGINEVNTATNYRSGNELTLEYALGYHAAPTFKVGLNGYLYRQLTDDLSNGAPVNGNGNRGTTNAIGPFATYNFSPKGALMVKLLSEYGTVNKPEGTRLWIQTKVAF